MKVKVYRKNEGEKKVEIRTEFIRLDALLKFTGCVSTGGEAKQLISEGLALVNGEPCLMRGKKIFPGNRVEFGGEAFLVGSAVGN